MQQDINIYIEWCGPYPCGPRRSICTHLQSAQYPPLPRYRLQSCSVIYLPARHMPFRQKDEGREGGENGEKEEVKGGRERGTGDEKQRRDTERKEAMSEKECSGDDNMLMMRGAGGKTHSVVVYRLTEPMKDRGKRREEKMKTTWPRFSKLIAPRAPLLILIKRLYLAKIKSMQAPRMPLQISLDPVIHKKTSPTAERHQVVGEKRH